MLFSACGDWAVERSFTVYCGATDYEGLPRPKHLTTDRYVETVLVPAILEYRRINEVVPKDLAALVPQQLPCIYWPLGIRHRWRYGVVAENGNAKRLHVAFSPRGWSPYQFDSDGPRPKAYHVKLGQPGASSAESWWETE